MQCSGIGKLQPNILVLGYKTNWQEEETNDVCGYIDIIHDAFDQNLNVAILRLPQGKLILFNLGFTQQGP